MIMQPAKPTGGSRQKSPLISQYYRLVIWIQDRLVRFPKVERGALVPQIGNLATGLLLVLVEAYYSRQKLELLRKANLMLEQLRLVLRLSKDRKLLTLTQYQYASKEMVEIGKQLGGWINHQKGVEK